MALIHHFMLVSPDISKQMVPFRETYITDGIMQRYKNFESVPKPINDSADSDAGDILMAFYKKNKGKAVCVQDDYILKVLTDFNVIETYYIGFVPCMGLNYHSFTLIPWESLPAFKSVCINNSVCIRFAELVSLCNAAYSMKFDILHCGI